VTQRQDCAAACLLPAYSRRQGSGRARRIVRGLDATAAQTFGTLRSLLQRQGIELLICELRCASAQALLAAHGVIGPDACRRAARARPPAPRPLCATRASSIAQSM
jgi:hypothetical protein